jgi:hypothetical protein
MKIKILSLILIFTLACQKENRSDKGQLQPANESLMAQKTQLTDQLEDAVYALRYMPESMRKNGSGYVTTSYMNYELNFHPMEDFQVDKVELAKERFPLRITIDFNYAGTNSKYARGLTGLKIPSFYTKGNSSDFYNYPEKFDGAPIYIFDNENEIQVGRFLLGHDNKLLFSLCESEFADRCIAELSLKIPKLGSDLEKQLYEKPKRNPLDYFPYMVEFKLILKGQALGAGTVFGYYNIEKELK